MGEWLEIGPVGNRAYRATPVGGDRPAVLVLHAWWGLTSVFTDACDRLAGNGYTTLAPSLYAGDATTASIDEAQALAAASNRDPDAVAAIVNAAVDALIDGQPAGDRNIAVIGFSLGAYWALHLSQVRPDDVSAVVTVYGTDDGDYSTARAAYLGHFAENDDFEPLESVHELEARIRGAGREATFHIYPNAGHWFVEPNRPDAYDPAAAELVWSRTLAFLRAQLA